MSPFPFVRIWCVQYSIQFVPLFAPTLTIKSPSRVHVPNSSSPNGVASKYGGMMLPVMAQGMKPIGSLRNSSGLVLPITPMLTASASTAKAALLNSARIPMVAPRILYDFPILPAWRQIEPSSVSVR